MYKQCTTKCVTHFVLQTCSTDYHRVFCCAEEGQNTPKVNRYAKIRCRSSPVRKPLYRKCRHHDGDTYRYLEIQFSVVSVTIRIDLELALWGGYDE